MSNKITLKTIPKPEQEQKRGRGRPKLNRDPEEAKKSYVTKQHQKNRIASGKSDQEALVKLEDTLRLLKEYKASNPDKFIRLKIINSVINLHNLVKLIDGEVDLTKESLTDLHGH